MEGLAPLVRRPLSTVLLLALPAAMLSAQDKGKDQPKDDASAQRADSLAGETAPVGRWYTTGGSASRCGVSAAGPIFTSHLGQAWEYQVEGEVEEEPLAWDEHVVLVSVQRREGETPKERTLHVLRLHDGKPLLPPRRVVSDVPLGLSLWNRLIAYREGKQAIRVDQIGATQLGRRMRYETKGEVSAPLLFGNELYYTQDGRLERLDLGAQQPAWSLEGNFRGRVSLLGDHVFGLRFARLSEPTAAVVDRFTGKLVVQEHGKLHVPAVDHTIGAAIAATRNMLVARYEVDQPRDPLADPYPNTTFFVRSSSVNAERLSVVDVAITEKLPALMGRTTFGSIEYDERKHAWAIFSRVRGGLVYWHVADSERYGDVIARSVAPTVLGQTILVGDLAFDSETLRIAWRADLAPTQRTVPARQTLLVTSGGRLLALRDARALEPEVVAASATEIRAGAAVLLDGRIHRGKFAIDPAAKTLTLRTGTGKNETVPLAQVLWAEDGDKPLHWGDPMGVARAILLLIEDQQRKGYANLAGRVVRSNDVRAISRYLVEALELGADEKEVASAQRQIESLRRGALRVDYNVLRAVEAEEAKLRNSLGDLPWQRAKSLQGKETEELRWMLADLALLLAKDHPGASQWVRDQLPAGMTVPEPFVAQQWLIFADACRRRPMRVVAEGSAEYAWELEQLAKARETWRKDLMAVCSERLCVLAPPEVAGAAARCLATGELVIDALESMFAGMGTSRAGDKRLLVKLYATRDEYIERAAEEALVFEKARREREMAEAKKEGEDVPSGEESEKDEPKSPKEAAEEFLREKRGLLSMTLGFFVPDEGVTRLFMPSGKEAYLDVVSTFAHELTHQWLELRGPRVDGPKLVAPRVVRPGHWIVEGFPTFIESFVWDVEQQKWHSDGTSSEFEFFARSKPEQRNAWAQQLRLHQMDMHRRLDKEPEHFVRRDSYLGVQMLSEWNMFYVQGAATCHYLFHAEDGKYRKRLLEYVLNYYSGWTDALAPDQAFDVGAGELGRRIEEYFARKMGPGAGGK